MVEPKETETPLTATQNIAFGIGMMISAGLGSKVQIQCMCDSLITLAKKAGVEDSQIEAALGFVR